MKLETSWSLAALAVALLAGPQVGSGQNYHSVTITRSAADWYQGVPIDYNQHGYNWQPKLHGWLTVQEEIPIYGEPPSSEWVVTRDRAVSWDDISQGLLAVDTTNNWIMGFGTEAESPLDYLNGQNSPFVAVAQAGWGLGFHILREGLDPANVLFTDDVYMPFPGKVWSPHRSIVLGPNPLWPQTPPQPTWPVCADEYDWITDFLTPTNFTLHTPEQSPQMSPMMSQSQVVLESEDTSLCYFSEWEETIDQFMLTNWPGKFDGWDNWLHPIPHEDNDLLLQVLRDRMPSGNFNPTDSCGSTHTDSCWTNVTHEFLYVAGLGETGQVWTLYYTTNLSTAWTSNMTFTIDDHGLGHMATTMPTNYANLFVIAKRVTSQGVTNLSPIFGLVSKVFPGNGAMTVFCNPLDNGENLVEEVFLSASEGDRIAAGNSAGSFVNITTNLNGLWSTNCVLPLGTGFAYVNNSTNDRTVVFRGQVVQHSTNSLPTGLCVRGSILPRSGHVHNDLGLPVSAGDSVQTWNGSGYDTSVYAYTLVVTDCGDTSANTTYTVVEDPSRRWVAANGYTVIFDGGTCNVADTDGHVVATGSATEEGLETQPAELTGATVSFVGVWDNPPMVATAEGFWISNGTAAKTWIQHWTPVMP